MAVKAKRIKCARCGERETVMPGERGPVSIYCDLCRDEAKREQNALRTQAYRQRKASYGGCADRTTPGWAADFVEVPSLVQAAPSSSSRRLTTGLLCGMVRADPVV